MRSSTQPRQQLQRAPLSLDRMGQATVVWIIIRWNQSCVVVLKVGFYDAVMYITYEFVSIAVQLHTSSYFGLGRS